MRSLLKYDFKYFWRLWWIGALVTAVTTALGIASMHRMQNSVALYARSASKLLDGLSITGVILCVIVLFAFVILTELLIMYRYYKNLYTDEGYLTFTLPVTENTLLMSKSISGFVTIIVTAMVTTLLGFLFSLSGIIFDLGLEMTIKGCQEAIYNFFTELGPLAGVYIIEIILLIVIGLLFNIQLGYISITIGAIIAKKNKLLAGIGVYFAIQVALSILMNIMATLGIISLEAVSWYEQFDTIVAIGFAIIIGILIALTVLAYVINLWFMKRKLNLA